MSSNLPVRWVPPITPPSPEDRPPRRSGRRGLLIAAAAIAVSTVAAVAVMSGGGASRIAEGPGTGGGNQPYLVTGASAPTEKPAVPATTEKPAAPASAERPASRQIVDGPSAPAPITSEKPATSAAHAPPAPTAPSPVPTADAPAPTAAAATPGTNSAPHDGVRVIDLSKKPGEANPSTAARAPARPATSPASAPPRPAGQETTAVPPPTPTTTPTRTAEPTAAPALRQTATEPTIVTPPPSEPRRRPVALDDAGATRTTAASGDRGDFADRLATIRRSEENSLRRTEEPVAPRVLGAPPRWLEPPPSVVDEEDTRIVTPAPMREPRRGWRRDWAEDGGPIPPAGIDDEPSRPALRSFDPPGRIARDRSTEGENCHFHAYPADDMAFHRDVRCHWHDDARDPSIRYVR